MYVFRLLFLHLSLGIDTVSKVNVCTGGSGGVDFSMPEAAVAAFCNLLAKEQRPVLVEKEVAVAGWRKAVTIALSL